MSAFQPLPTMKPSIHSLLAVSLLAIPCASAQEPAAPIPPPGREARAERPPQEVRPERLQAQRREHAQAGRPAEPGRRDVEAPAPPQPPAGVPGQDGPRRVAPETRWAKDIEHERRMMMERIDRMERETRERDAAIGKATRELNARIDRLETVMTRPAPEAKREPKGPVPDERIQHAAREIEERMKHLKEMEAKLGDRARDLHQMEEKLGKRERELREMEEKLKAGAEKLEIREKRLREAGKDLREKGDRDEKRD